MFIGSSFLIVLAWLLAIPIIVLLIETVAAIFLPQRRMDFASGNAGRPRVAVIVPAHNESNGILPTLGDIKKQLTPGDRLLVIADNCDDDTAAVALAEGAEVVERNEPQRTGKGYALDFGFKHLDLDPPAVVISIDADCRVKEGTIDRLAKACQIERRPIQALDLMTAPTSSPPNYRVAEFAWRIKNWIRPLGLGALRLPCHLMGTGMAFPWGLIRSNTVASGSIVEDVKLSLELAEAGRPALFCPQAVVTSQFPQSAEGVRGQRKRWEKGSIGLIGSTVPRLIWKGITTKNFGLIALALDSVVPPLSLLAMLVVGLFFVTGTAALIGMPFTAFYISIACVMALFLSTALSWVKYGRDLLPLNSIPSVGSYVLAKLPLYREIFSERTAPSWVRADRSGISTATKQDTSVASSGPAVPSSLSSTTVTPATPKRSNDS